MKVDQIGCKPPKEPWFYSYLEFIGWLNHLLSLLLMAFGGLGMVGLMGVSESFQAMLTSGGVSSLRVPSS